MAKIDLLHKIVTFRYADAMDKKCAWAYRIFQEWVVFHNNAAKTDSTKASFIRSLSDTYDWECVYALTRFILEVHKKSGDVYLALFANVP